MAFDEKVEKSRNTFKKKVKKKYKSGIKQDYF